MNTLNYKDGEAIVSRREVIFEMTERVNARMPSPWKIETGLRDNHYGSVLDVSRGGERIARICFHGDVPGELPVYDVFVEGVDEVFISRVCGAVSAASDRVVSDLEAQERNDREARERRIRTMMEELSGIANSAASSFNDVEAEAPPQEDLPNP